LASFSKGIFAKTPLEKVINFKYNHKYATSTDVPVVPIDKRQNMMCEVVEDAAGGDGVRASAPCKGAPYQAARIAVILVVDIIKRRKIQDHYHRLRDLIVVSE
jgi:hypothetical protein